MPLIQSFLSAQGVQCDNGFWAMHSLSWANGRDYISIIYRGYYTAAAYANDPDAYLDAIAVDVPITLNEFMGLGPVLDQWVSLNNVKFLGATLV